MCATAVVNMLSNPTPVLNRAIFVRGVEGLTQNALLEALEAETGTRFEVEHIDIDKIKRDALGALESGDWRAASRGLTITNQFMEEDGDELKFGTVENELVGVKAVSVREAVRAVLQDQNQTPKN